ncbi:MAG: hypothetical protein K2M93_02110 [Muribaculaceae bacterium]|nr:hypothetical protein [Muribaculaceae bacterium]
MACALRTRYIASLPGGNPFLAKPLAAFFAATECPRYCGRDVQRPYKL